MMVGKPGIPRQQGSPIPQSRTVQGVRQDSNAIRRGDYCDADSLGTEGPANKTRALFSEVARASIVFRAA